MRAERVLPLRTSVIAGVVIAASLAPPSAHGETRTAYYVANAGAAVGLNPDDPNPLWWPFTFFSPTGEPPTTIEVVDLIGIGIGVRVCQDHNTSNANCGPGDASFRFCVPQEGGAVKIPRKFGFTGDIETAVFIDASGASTGCDVQATAGTIELTM